MHARACAPDRRLPADEARAPLKVELPQGNLIGLARERLPVVVTCACAAPASFSAPLEFVDDVGWRGGVCRGGGGVSGSRGSCERTQG